MLVAIWKGRPHSLTESFDAFPEFRFYPCFPAALHRSDLRHPDNFIFPSGGPSSCSDFSGQKIRFTSTSCPKKNITNLLNIRWCKSDLQYKIVFCLYAVSVNRAESSWGDGVTFDGVPPHTWNMPCGLCTAGRRVLWIICHIFSFCRKPQCRSWQHWQPQAMKAKAEACCYRLFAGVGYYPALKGFLLARPFLPQVFPLPLSHSRTRCIFRVLSRLLFTLLPCLLPIQRYGPLRSVFLRTRRCSNVRFHRSAGRLRRRYAP